MMDTENPSSGNPGTDSIEAIWAGHVRDELRSLNEKVDKIRDRIEQISVDIGMLKVKAGVWGLIGGIIPVTVWFLVWLIKLKTP